MASAKSDDFGKSKFSPPQAGGDEGEGEITRQYTAAYHPHPDPPPLRGREFVAFYEGVKYNSQWEIDHEIQI
jgi:hypothetical protein